MGMSKTLKGDREGKKWTNVPWLRSSHLNLKDNPCLSLILHFMFSMVVSAESTHSAVVEVFLKINILRKTFQKKKGKQYQKSQMLEGPENGRCDDKMFTAGHPRQPPLLEKMEICSARGETASVLVLTEAYLLISLSDTVTKCLR